MGQEAVFNQAVFRNKSPIHIDKHCPGTPGDAKKRPAPECGPLHTVHPAAIGQVAGTCFFPARKRLCPSRIIPVSFRGSGDGTAPHSSVRLHKKASRALLRHRLFYVQFAVKPGIDPEKCLLFFLCVAAVQPIHAVNPEAASAGKRLL